MTRYRMRSDHHLFPETLLIKGPSGPSACPLGFSHAQETVCSWVQLASRTQPLSIPATDSLGSLYAFSH